MSEFTHSLARVAVWNLAGFNVFDPDAGIDPNSDRALRQAEGLALLDAELVTLVEVSPLSHIERLAELLSGEFGVEYDHTILEQPNGNIHIGLLHKPGVDVSDVQLVAGSEGDDPGGRQALQASIEIGGFRAVLIGVHQNRVETVQTSDCAIPNAG